MKDKDKKQILKSVYKNNLTLKTLFKDRQEKKKSILKHSNSNALMDIIRINLTCLKYIF